MKTSSISRVKESLVLLRQVREELANDPNCSLMVRLDAVIEGLEIYIANDIEHPSRMKEILNALGYGLASIPAIERLIEKLKDQ